MSEAQQMFGSTSGAQTAGSLIRQAREASGLHIAALAVSLKVPVRKLEALEADRLEGLHDAVFVRALASSVCRTLKLDPAAVLEKLPQAAAPSLQPDPGLDAPFRSAGDDAALTASSRMRQPAALAILALVMAALIIGLWPDLERTARQIYAVLVPAESLNPTLPPKTPSNGGVVKPIATTVAAPVLMEPAPVTVMQVEPPQQAASVASQLVSPAPTVTVAAASSAAELPKAAASQGLRSDSSSFAASPVGLLQFRASAASWVEVTDAKGVVLLRRMLTPGEVSGTSGAVPLTVVVGRADVVEVQVRGKPFDIASATRANVAHFEVK